MSPFQFINQFLCLWMLTIYGYMYNLLFYENIVWSSKQEIWLWLHIWSYTNNINNSLAYILICSNHQRNIRLLTFKNNIKSISWSNINIFNFKNKCFYIINWLQRYVWNMLCDSIPLLEMCWIIINLKALKQNKKHVTMKIKVMYFNYVAYDILPIL